MASLVHYRGVVSVSLESSTSEPSAEPPHSGDSPPNDVLQASLYAALQAQLPELVAQWFMQCRMLISPDVLKTEGGDGRAEDAGIVSHAVRVLLAGLAVADEEPGASIVVGFGFGTEAFERGASLHHTEKAFHLLVAIVMDAMETTAARSDTPSGDVTDGIRLAHQLQRRAALLSLAATRGYMQAHGKALREQFRHLRHDLRNPLGTIKSVLALMDDESVPSEARANPNFRTMAKRNARSLEEIIADRLSDEAAPFSPTTEREIALYTVADAVHRTLRREAVRRGVTILVGASQLRGRFDAAGLELVLHGILVAALQESRAGEHLHLDFEDVAGNKAAVRLSCESGLAPIANRDTLERLATLAHQLGASATFSDHVLITVPMRRSVAEGGFTIERERPVLHDSVELGNGEPPHDLRSPRDGDHGQASVL